MCPLRATLLPEISQAEFCRPMFDVGDIAAGCGQVPHIAHLDFRSGILRPEKFRNGQVFLACDPSREIVNRDSPPPVELAPPVRRVLAHDAVTLMTLSLWIRLKIDSLAIESRTACSDRK